MLKVILNNPSEIEVAVFKKLEEEGTLKVVYTICSKASKNRISRSFPEASWREFEEMFEKGLSGFFDDVDWRLVTPELLDTMSDAEITVLDMMDRIDTTKSHTHQERKQLYKYLISYWMQVIEQLKPDIFYSKTSPHEISDYVLFALCKTLNIRVVLFTHTSLEGRWFISNDFRHPWKKLQKSLKKKNKVRFEDLSRESQNRINVIRSSYDKAKPVYFIEASEKQLKENTSNLSRKKSLQKLKEILRIPLKVIFGFRKQNPHKLKRKLSAQIAKTEFKTLPSFYNSIVEEIDYSKPYIYFLLNFQPENTTSPQGGLFNDQALAIATLSLSVPNGWHIYVKEHPSQFFTVDYYGYLRRDRNFYKNIMSLPNVSFISRDNDHFKALDNAKCSATITGTVGWESIVRGKPALVFGEAWYQDAPGVYRVRTLDDAKKAIDTINQKMKIVDDDLFHFVKSVEESSVQVFFDDIEANWSGVNFDFKQNSNVLKNIIKDEILSKE